MKKETARREIEALDYYLQNHTNDYSEESHMAMMMAIKTLEQEPCEDAVSRKAVIDTLDRMDKVLDVDRTVEMYRDLLKECYTVLPSVNPQKIGNWIFDKERLGYWISKCSACGHLFHGNEILIYRPKYCANCGAKMVEPWESEE